MARHTMFNLSDHLSVYKGSVKISKSLLCVLQGAFLAVIVGICAFGYRWYSTHRAQLAQKQFSDGVKEYTNAVTGQPGHQNWSMLGALFELGAQEYGKTSLAPFYLGYQADALVKNDQLADATTVMTRAATALPTNSDFYYSYALKQALMSIDVAEAAGVSPEDAERNLLDLAYNKNNPQRDAALFYLGRYYLAKNNPAQAREVLTELTHAFPERETSGASPWVKEAESLLKRIVA